MERRLESSVEVCIDEPVWVVMHICMETTQKICLYSCLHVKMAKMLCFSYYLFCFLFNKIREQEGGTGSAPRLGRWEWGGGP
jgi:hypothetical protein